MSTFRGKADITGRGSFPRRRWLRDRLCSRLYGKGSTTMTTPSEYRRMAKDCLCWARQAHSDNVQHAYPSMDRGRVKIRWQRTDYSGTDQTFCSLASMTTRPERFREKAMKWSVAAQRAKEI